MEWNVVSRKVWGVLVEVDVESLRLLNGLSTNDQSLSGLDTLGELGTVRDILKN